MASAARRPEEISTDKRACVWASAFPLPRIVANRRPETDPSIKIKPMPGSGAQFLSWHKRYDLVPGAVFSFFRGRKDCLDIEIVLAGFFLANAPDFIDDGVPRHELFSHWFFRYADDRAFTRILPADQGQRLGIAAFPMCAQFQVIRISIRAHFLPSW
jgi:hypothetical protein